MPEHSLVKVEDEWMIVPRGEGLSQRAREFFESRQLLKYFAIQSVGKTYRRTHLGALWLLIRPIFPLLIGLFVFQGLVGDHVTETPYLIFYVSGLSIWQLFSQCLSWVTRSLESNRRLLKKLYFPRLILPVAFISPAVVEFCIQLIVLTLIAGYYFASTGTWYLQISGYGVVYIIGALVLTIGLALGIGLWTCVLAAEARDVRYLTGYVLGFWLYMTPIFYPLEAIPEQYRILFRGNPMSCASDLFRKGIIGTGSVPAIDIVVAGTIVAITFGLGLLFFSRYEKILADHV